MNSGPAKRSSTTAVLIIVGVGVLSLLLCLGGASFFLFTRRVAAVTAPAP